MAAVIIGIILLLVIILNSKSDKKKNKNLLPPRPVNSNYNAAKKSKDYPASSLVTRQPRNLLKMEEISDGSSQDGSIIEVTGAPYQIPRNALVKYEKEVPYWKHQYVYSYSELNSASKEQKEFYEIFKARFKSEEYLDVEGNSNYYFILLFDLLENEFPKHKSLGHLEYLLDQLSYYYPKTAPYAKGFLVRKMQEAGDTRGVNRVWAKQTNMTVYNPTGAYEFRENLSGLGTRYKTRLSLSDDQVKVLNAIPFPENNFFNIDFCRLEIIRLFLNYISILEQKYLEKGTTLEKEFKSIADCVATREYQQKVGSSYYNYTVESIISEIYSNIFKHAENAVREAYSHKRKLSTDCIYTDPEIKSRFKAEISNTFEELKPLVIEKIQKPSKTAEIELNAQNTTRWKSRFGEIELKHSQNPSRFFEKVQKLAELNVKNPAIENIYLEGSKAIAKVDKELALKLYLYYLDFDLKSATFDNRQLTKTIQKSLFKSNEQLHEFEKIVNDLINDKDLETALSRIPDVYSVKRKKITLDKASIQQVEQQHAGTVDLLNEYLEDEYDGEKNKITSREISQEEISIRIQPKNDKESNVIDKRINLSDIQRAVLELFVKSNFQVSQPELEMFAKERNLFKNQLVESINECCFESLDDNIIEEDEDYYQVNQDYYKKIMQ